MYEEIVTICVALIGLAGTVLGAKYGKQYQTVKSKYSKVLDVLTTVEEAAKDDKVTEEEFQKILDAVMYIAEETVEE